jgi:hypothetical protein
LRRQRCQTYSRSQVFSWPRLWKLTRRTPTSCVSSRSTRLRKERWQPALTPRISPLHRRQRMFHYGFGITRPNKQRRFQDALKEWERASLLSVSERTWCGQAVSTDATSTRPVAAQPSELARRSRKRHLAEWTQWERTCGRTWQTRSLFRHAASKGATTTVAKKGFKAFPITTLQMILFASEQDAGSARSAPVHTNREILGLTNAAYVAQHLHHHLKTRLGSDVLLPSGFCSAIRMALFIAITNDRPEAFTLVSCGPQPLDKKSLTGSADELMRM